MSVSYDPPVRVLCMYIHFDCAVARLNSRTAVFHYEGDYFLVIADALRQQPDSGTQAPRVNVHYQFNASARDDVVRLAYAKELARVGESFVAESRNSMAEQDPSSIIDTVIRHSGSSAANSAENGRQTLAPVVFGGFTNQG